MRQMKERRAMWKEKLKKKKKNRVRKWVIPN